MLDCAENDGNFQTNRRGYGCDVAWDDGAHDLHMVQERWVVQHGHHPTNSPDVTNHAGRGPP